MGINKQTIKLNFSEIENTLSREEMKNIMAGSGHNCDLTWCNIVPCQHACVCCLGSEVWKECGDHWEEDAGNGCQLLCAIHFGFDPNVGWCHA